MIPYPIGLPASPHLLFCIFHIAFCETVFYDGFCTPPDRSFHTSAFDWTSEHWAQMASQSQVLVQARNAATQAKEAEMQRQAIEKMVLTKQRDDAAIGTFEL